MLSLVLNPGLPEERHFSLAPGTITIGRTKDNAVFFLHKSLSRKHAQVEFDGVKVQITDLQSKNGIYVRGNRVTRCELVEGDSFRCGEITFRLERARNPSATGRVKLQDGTVKTLPSPLATSPVPDRRAAPASAPRVSMEDDHRYGDKLFLLVRASELCVSAMGIDKVLEELIDLAVQVLEVDRIVLLTLDDDTLEMKPRVLKSFVPPARSPYSVRVVSWVVDHGIPASFVDVSRDRTLPGSLTKDESVHGAICVPINPGAGTIGVIYADSVSRSDCFRPDDLALLRAIANLAAVAIERAALRSSNGDRQTRLTR